MKVTFLTNHKPREQQLSKAMRAGLAAHGDRLSIAPYDEAPHDLGCDALAFVGVKCHEWHDWCCDVGKPFIYMDKGYYYPEEKTYLAGRPVVNCWRASVNTNQPLEYLATARHSTKRWNSFAGAPRPWREPSPNGFIMIAGSSPKFHQFHGLPHPTAWAQEVVDELRQYTDRPIHYRPKPSWWIRARDDATPIEGCEFVPERSFEDRLVGAHAVVTYGSNAALIGMLAGVPGIILGNGVMRLISSTDLAEIEAPRLASDDERMQLLANLAHSQFTLSEWRRGEAWAQIKPML